MLFAVLVAVNLDQISAFIMGTGRQLEGVNRCCYMPTRCFFALADTDPIGAIDEKKSRLKWR